MLQQGTSVYFPDYGWFFAISMIAVIFAIYYNSINQLNNNMILNFGRAIWVRSRRYQKSKHKVPEASHIAKKKPAIESKGHACCLCLNSVSALDCQDMNHCDVRGVTAHTNCSGNSHKDCKCVRHQWAVLPSDMADQSEKASFCCYCKEPFGRILVADAAVLYCMWCQRLVHVDCCANLAKETGDRCDLGPVRNVSHSTKHLHHVDYAGIVTAINGGNNGMATKQEVRATGVSGQPINGIKRKNGENKVDELKFDGTNGEKRSMILLNPLQVGKKDSATCITTAEDLEAKKLKLKLIKTGLDANSIRTCTICNIVCNSDKAFASHIAGEKHMVNSKGLAQVLMSQQAVCSANASNPDKEPKMKKKNMLSALQAPRVAQSVYCDICKVTCNTQEIYDNHVAGQKHNKKIKNLSMGNKPIQFVPAISTSHEIQTPATDDNDQEHMHTSSQLEPKPIGKSMCGSKEDLEMKKRKVLEKGAKGDAVKVCELCNVVCTGPTVFESHCNGQKHKNMVKKQEENFGVAVAPDVPTANDIDQVHMDGSSQTEPKPTGKSKTALKQDLEVKKRKVLEKGAKGDEVKVCELCNVVCTSPTVFESHCKGQKHKSKVKKQEENFGGLAAVAPTTNDNYQENMHASSQLEPKPKRKGKSACKEDIEMKKRKLLESGVKSDAVKVCSYAPCAM